jgi:hypothetical protein
MLQIITGFWLSRAIYQGLDFLQARGAGVCFIQIALSSCTISVTPVSTMRQMFLFAHQRPDGLIFHAGESGQPYLGVINGKTSE